MERDLRILDFEGSWWLYPGPKDRAIRDYLGISSTRYYQALRRLVDDPAALGAAPMVVRRLRKIREARAEAAMERLGDSGPAV